MANNYLITGYWGEPHVTTENDRGIHAGIFGAGRFVLPVGEQFRAEYIGNNTIRVYDGKLMDNGAAAGIPVGEYVDLLVANAGQGMNRNDLIVFQYVQDAATMVERGTFIVVQGTETSGTAADPVLTQSDLLSGKAALDQMALWRVPVSGTVISAPVQLFEVSKNIKNAGVSVVEATSSDGETYSATVPGVTELYAGLEIVIIPQLESTSETITLDVNGLGAKSVRLPLSSNTTTLVMPEQPNYYTAGRPVKLRYDATWLNNRGAWVVAERQRTSGNDIYGAVPVESGGTGADNAEEARGNLGVAPAIESPDHPGCYYRMVSGETEWINPPMVMGTEYRSTERWNGKVVYMKIIDIGALPNATSTSYSHGLGAKSIVRCYGTTSDVYGRSIPFKHAASSIDLSCDRSAIRITTSTDESAANGYITVHYTKD